MHSTILDFIMWLMKELDEKQKESEELKAKADLYDEAVEAFYKKIILNERNDSI